jgi:hypothetical protein
MVGTTQPGGTSACGTRRSNRMAGKRRREEEEKEKEKEKGGGDDAQESQIEDDEESDAGDDSEDEYRPTKKAKTGKGKAKAKVAQPKKAVASRSRGTPKGRGTASNATASGSNTVLNHARLRFSVSFRVSRYERAALTGQSREALSTSGQVVRGIGFPARSPTSTRKRAPSASTGAPSSRTEATTTRIGMPTTSRMFKRRTSTSRGSAMTAEARRRKGKSVSSFVRPSSHRATASETEYLPVDLKFVSHMRIL